MSNIILASKSVARQAMMQQAGIKFKIVPANINEEEIQNKGGAPEVISKILAEQKAVHISNKNKDSYIIGSDQVLSMEDKIYSKAKNKVEAQARLIAFSGKEHTLTSTVAVAKDSKIIFSYTGQATLKMKPLNQEEIKNYIAVVGDVVTQCVGCYAIEGRGITLFEEIEGDYFTILGMPLLPLLNFLDAERLL